MSATESEPNVVPLLAFPETYENQDMVIFIIKKELFPDLENVLYNGMEDTMANTAVELLDILDEVFRHISVYHLKNILAKKPQQDVAIIQIGGKEQIRMGYWKPKQEVVQWPTDVKYAYSTLMGSVKEQLGHDICWTIVVTDMISILRLLTGRDTEWVDYSTQDLVDFACPTFRCQLKPSKGKDKGDHYCYGYPLSEGYEYVRTKGVPKAERPLEKKCNRDVTPRSTSNLTYIGKTVSPKTIEEVLSALRTNPVSATIPIFEPEYSKIGNKIYRGPTSLMSKFEEMHAVNIVDVGEENGEKFLWVRSSHGISFGVDGNLKVSIEVMMACLTRGVHISYMEHPFPLIGEFIYPTLLSLEEEENMKGKDFESNDQNKRAEKAMRLSGSFVSCGFSGRDSDGAPQLKGARWFSYEELMKITNNFSVSFELGYGGYRKVYRGMLQDGQLVAIKRAQDKLEFKTEIELLCRLHHKNLIGLVGYCFEQGEQILVYEFMSNGSLEDVLTGRTGIILDWQQRLRVALGSAEGLAYLHELADPPIVHNNVKSSNILLDENLTCKVAGFCLSKLVSYCTTDHVSTQVKGTLGNLDPEDYTTHELTAKSDVYNFGVVMFELIMAKQLIEKGKYTIREIKLDMNKSDVEYYGLRDKMDRSLREGGVLPEFGRYVELALRCVDETADKRPTMSQVVKEIESMS